MWCASWYIKVVMSGLLCLSLLLTCGCRRDTEDNNSSGRSVYNVPFAEIPAEIDGSEADASWRITRLFFLPDLRGSGQPTTYRLLHTEETVCGIISCTDSALVPVDMKGNKDRGDKVTVFFQNVPNTIWLRFSIGQVLMAGVQNNLQPSTEPPTPTPFRDNQFSAAVAKTKDGWTIEFSFVKSALSQRGGQIDDVRFHLFRTNAQSLNKQYFCSETDTRICLAQNRREK